MPERDGAEPGRTGYVHSVETAGAVDGPGIRYVVFLSGCPLTCAYCHNPDCLTMKRGGRPTDAEALMDDIRAYKRFMQATGGGVTISGGEPLVQPEFTLALLKACKQAGLHTALDTSGYLGARASDALLANTDLVLLDIKSGLPDVYRKTTGVDLKPTLDFARRLDTMGKPVWVRFVLVPGLTDGEDNLVAVNEIVAGLGTVERLEILPFHKMGEHKWQALGLNYTLGDTQPPTEAEIARARNILGRNGVNVLV
ncbi:MAG: pyruvate formate lyase-activating protein [Alphaproteobacteria bacterium]|nr:pyruvate formate lyase-activating protein [Alphaproteobacteria bacterium]